MPNPSPAVDESSRLIRELGRKVDTLSSRLVSLESSSAIRALSTASPLPTGRRARQRARSQPPPRAAPPPTTESHHLRLAQTFSKEDATSRHLCTVAVPDALAGHVVGRGGRGLKQVTDISGARVSAFEPKDGPKDERLVSIRGTDQQIGAALVVIGKRLARQRVRAPRSKKPTASSDGPAKAERKFPQVSSTFLPPLAPVQPLQGGQGSRSPPSTVRSPSFLQPPNQLPHTPPSVPSVTMSSPASTPEYPGTPMDIGRAAFGDPVKTPAPRREFARRGRNF
jgi:hypothetical protein